MTERRKHYSARELFDAVTDRIEGAALPDGTITVIVNQDEFLASLKWGIEESAKLDALREELGEPEYIRRYWRIVPQGPVYDAEGRLLTPEVTYCVIDEAMPKTEEFNYGSVCMGCDTREDAQAFIDEALARHDRPPGTTSVQPPRGA